MAAIVQISKLDDILKGKTLKKIEFAHVDELGAAIDLSGTTIRCQFRQKRKTGKVAVDLTLGSGLTLSGAGNNVVEVDQILALDWDADLYFYEIAITTTATGVINTYVEGTMKVLQNTTGD
jgi:hypothetical protein